MKVQINSVVIYCNVLIVQQQQLEHFQSLSKTLHLSVLCFLEIFS